MTFNSNFDIRRPVQMTWTGQLGESLLEDNELKDILTALKENINSVNTLKLDEVDLTNDVILHLSNMLMENHFLQR